MENVSTIMDTLSNIDVDAELSAFLCSFIVFCILMAVRNRALNKGGKTLKHIEPNTNQVTTAKRGTRLHTIPEDAHDDAHHVQNDKALRAAFEEEDYWEVLRCWNEVKHAHQSSIHLSMVIRAMRSCNKGGFYIVTELRNFFKAHPQARSVSLINDLLEPLARGLEDTQLVDMLVRMIPSLNLVKDSRTYEILLTMHAANGSLDKAQEVSAEMKKNGVVFTPRAIVAVLTMGLQMGNSDVVLKSFVKLKPSWDVRSTWAVSMFAMERHKADILKQIVALAFQDRKVAELSAALEGMTVPEEVSDATQAKISLLSDVELATTVTILEKSGASKKQVVYNLLVSCLTSRSNVMSSPWRLQKRDCADSSASTSEGSRSDSEEESNSGRSFSPPPGLSLASDF